MPAHSDSKLSHTESRSDQPTDANETPHFRQTMVVTNRQGREEAFTIGPDGFVWSFFPDAVNASGFADYKFVSLGMPADLLTLARDAFGCLVVIAVKGLRIRYRVEQVLPDGQRPVDAPSRWSPVEYAPLPEIHGAISVQRIYAHGDVGSLRVSAIVDVEKAERDSGFAMAYCHWKNTGPNVFDTFPTAHP